ncbi:MAG: TIGR00270 family protein [Candidatus Heimdallarchaeota archaeon]|nr:TIGR00270 family protein [Candidatus Heimdallarchaeota archaeon]
MSCEMCGSFAGPELEEYDVDGVKMLLCPKCSKFGTRVTKKPVHVYGHDEDETSVSFVRDKPGTEGKSVSHVKVRTRAPPSSSRQSSRKRRRKSRDVLASDEVLIEDYGAVIKQARKDRGLSLDDFAQMINEKASLLQKIEKSEFRPSDQLIVKIERKLDVSLREEAAAPIYTSLSSKKETTLGDIIKLKKKKK